ncbi:MAG: threonine-phosphate decarboxylase CobD [Xanthobacteraceae bacterium]
MVIQAAEPLQHGGDLAQARRLFPDAPEPFIDLSTGINPYSYPLPPMAPDLFARLPQADALDRLAAAAAAAYGAPSPACVVVAPGTQSLLPLIAALVPPGRAAILTPTYAEHARAAARAGHRVIETPDREGLRDADLAILVNPNNPDGRVLSHANLLAMADDPDQRGSLLVVDEAFMDVGPPDASLGPDVMLGNIVVLRSFGKFFGLAGLRLGFAISAPDTAERLRASLGPWAVSGPALEIGAAALADRTWITAMQDRLAQAARRLDTLLTGAGLEIVGGTALFRLTQCSGAPLLFNALGGAGILVRRFDERPDWLRFGLPGDEPAWDRLARVLASAQGRVRRMA